MNILQINKFYFLNGGSEQCIFSLIDLLEKNNHHVIPFSMKHSQNFESPHETYFVNNVDYNATATGYLQKIKTGLKALYSIEAQKKMHALLTSNRPDIAHIHNFNYQLTSSILSPLKQRNIPVVQTLHDYHMICPSHNLYDFEGMQICEDCCNGGFFNAVKRKCLKGSAMTSLIGALEGYLAEFLHVYTQKIDGFICPSLFLKNKMVAHGLAPQKVIHIPNFVDPEAFEPQYKGMNYLVYFGRLEKFKGIHTLIEAFKTIRDAELYVLGDGSLKSSLKDEVNKHKMDHVRILGFKTGKQLTDIIRHSLCTVIPSEWYENNPLSVLESFAIGKPVIGSDIGGIPELIQQEETGLLFEPGNSEDLSKTIQYCLNRKTSLEAMGRRARERIEKQFTPAMHYQKTIDFYHEMRQ